MAKGNRIEVLYKHHHFDEVNTMIEEGPTNNYPKIMFTINWLCFKMKLTTPKSTVSRMYYLPKISQPNKSVRTIASGSSSPTDLISQWLAHTHNGC